MAGLLGPDVGDLVGLPERVEEQLSDVPARCLAFNRWGTLLAAGCAHGAVAVYDYQTRGVAALLEGGHAPDTDVAAVLWSGDGRVLLSGGRDGSVTAWDVATGRVRQRLRLTSPGVVTHLAWVSGEVQHLLAGGQEDEVLVSRSGGPAVLLRLSNCHEQQLPVVCIDADGKLPSAGTSSDVDGTCSQVAVASHDGAIIYAGTRGAVMVLRRSDLALLDVIKVGDGGARVLGLQLTSRGHRLMVTAADQHIRIYLLHRHDHPQPPREQRLVSAAGGTWLAAAPEQPHQLSLQDWPACDVQEARRAAASAAAQPRRHSIIHENDQAWMTWLLDFLHDNSRRAWKCAAFSPDCEYFAAADEGPGHVVHLYEAEAEARMNAVLEGQSARGGVLALCWHPSSVPMQLLVLSTAGTIFVWAKAFTENWSAFAPDFAELTTNSEYVEPEDEFDMNPRPAAEQQREMLTDGPRGDDEAEDVDIGSADTRVLEIASQLGVPPGGQMPLLHMPLLLHKLSPSRGTSTRSPLGTASTPVK